MFLGFMCGGNEAFYILLYIRVFCADYRYQWKERNGSLPHTLHGMERTPRRHNSGWKGRWDSDKEGARCGSKEEDEKEHQVPRSLAMTFIADMKFVKNGSMTKAPADIPVDQIVEDYLASLPKGTEEEQ
ncbi:hypothetical protein B9Z55_027860 [Caenorhabditis nigoni]|nr:hypothetical protein B9Z55_027860 [Caenorhabditis nigoni]